MQTCRNLGNQDVIEVTPPTDLTKADVWGCPGQPIELIETHISWVALTPRFAYKIRKPVKYEFVDFSTLERRHVDCLEEMRLNQRLAPHVYLGVLPLTRDAHGRVQLNGSGVPVEWVVKMRRLAADTSLEQRIVRGRLKPVEVQRVAQYLTEFYERLPPLPMPTENYRRSFEGHIRANHAELLGTDVPLDRAVVQRVHAAQLRTVRLYPELLDNRVRDGRIVEGHGDLRPEHIYLTPAPVVIDCVEFRRDFRELDVLDELCFLAMECERLGAAYVGTEILAHYRRSADDRAPAALEHLYRAYRACVRAKAHVLRARQLTGREQAIARGEARDYIQLADRHASRLGPPLLLLVRGTSGTGKTSLAAELADRLALEHLSTDVVREQLFGKREHAEAGGDGRYSDEGRRRVYDALAERAEQLLSQGASVVLDGTYLARESRRRLLELAARQRSLALIVECHCPLAVAQQRIAERLAGGPQPSEAWPELALRQTQVAEDDLPDWPHVRVNTLAELPELVQQLETLLADRLQPYVAGPAASGMRC